MTKIVLSDFTCFKSTNDKENVKKTKYKTMFVRSPKHFKDGKQFINLYKLNKLKVYKIFNKNIFIILIYSKNLNLYYSILNFLNLSYLPEKNPISIKITTYINISFSGWCFIFKYNN